jgi:hypothetical protein
MRRLPARKQAILPGCGSTPFPLESLGSKGNQPMTTESVLRDAANRAYIAAFLLSGSAERAEAAVLESIRLMNSDVASGEELLQDAVHAAIELEEICGQRVGELGLDSSTLPFELQCVLHLPQYPRQCLVLRVLVRLPRDTCARLLRSELNQIDEGTHAGLLELRTIMDKRPFQSFGTSQRASCQ